MLDAAFRRVGVLRVDAIEDLFAIAEVLAKQPRPKGRRLTIVTNAGGPGVLATDALIGGGGQLTELTPEATEAFNAILPAPWSHNNPVDIIGDAPPERYAAALEVAGGGSRQRRAARHPHAPGDDRSDPDGRAARAVRPLDGQARAGELDGRARRRGRARRSCARPASRRSRTPTRPSSMFNYMWRYADSLHALYETPTLPDDATAPSTATLHTT